MSELMAACVEIWESDPETLAYHGSGYIALGDGAQVDDLTTVHERQQQIGYPSQLILGEAEVAAHMRSLFHDWRAPGLSVCLHERAGRLRLQPRLDARPRVQGARGGGARSRRASRSPASSSTGPARSRASQTSTGPIAVEQVVVAVGPWIADAVGDARPAGAPGGRGRRARRCGPTGTCRRARSTSTRAMFVTNDGALPPVVHVDSHAPLHDDDGRLVTAEQWGIYYKQDRAQRPGRRLAAAEGPGVRARPLPDRHGRAGLPRPLVRGALALHGALRGLPRRATARRARAASAPSPPTTSRSSTTCARTSSWPRTPTTATR